MRHRERERDRQLQQLMSYRRPTFENLFTFEMCDSQLGATVKWIRQNKKKNNSKLLSNVRQTMDHNKLPYRQHCAHVCVALLKSC